MSTQNTYAIYALCAIVISCYAMRNSEAHYLPDLFGLALALSAPRQWPALGAWLIVVLVRHTPLATGLARGVPDWLLIVVLPGARNMSIAAGESAVLESAYKERISEENDNDETDEIPQPVGENRDELITFGETRALARLVAQERIGLTEAVKIGAAAKSGAKYQKRSREVKNEVEKLRNHYPAGSNLKRVE